MRRTLRWARPAIAAVALAAVVWRLGTGPFVDGARAIDARDLLAGAAIFFVATVCCAVRWRVVARGLGLRLTLPAAVAAYYRCLFLNVSLPSGVAGDVHRAVSHGRDTHDLGGAFRAVVWERTAGQVVQVALTISVLLVLPSPVRHFVPYVVIALAAAAVLLSLFVSRWQRARDALLADIRKGLLYRNALPAIVLSTTVAVVGYAAIFVIAAHTAGVTAPVLRLLPLALLAVLAMVLPSIAGWGPREGATAWVFSAAGLGADRGAATAVVYGVMVLAASLPGAVVLVVARLPRRVVVRAQGAADA